MDIKELNFMDRFKILMPSFIMILGVSFAAAILIYITHMPKMIICLVQDVMYSNLQLSTIWLSVIVFSILIYILRKLFKLILLNIEIIEYLCKDNIVKVIVQGKTKYIPKSFNPGDIIKYMKSEGIYYDEKEK